MKDKSFEYGFVTEKGMVISLKTISIYVHIPFCRKKCNYCSFYSLPDCDDGIKQQYTDALIRQIKAFETDSSIKSIYFGGGTPPVLGVKRLLAIFEEIKSSFSLAEDCEITLEVNPRSVTLDELIMLREAGFNRISMGMQSADDNELAVLGRTYTNAQYEYAMRSVSAAGFVNISTDIIFALPEQTKEGLVKTLITAINMNIPHISVYSLSIEGGTPFYYKRDSLCLPDEDTEDEMYYLLCDIMQKHGYMHYEISSFSREGYESRHNLHYWDCGEYIGFGAAAHSFYNGKRFSNIADVGTYIALADECFYSPTDFNTQPVLSDIEKAGERIMLGLRTSKGIKTDDELIRRSEKFINNGYAVIRDGILSLTDKGYRISNSIIAELLV